MTSTPETGITPKRVGNLAWMVNRGDSGRLLSRIGPLLYCHQEPRTMLPPFIIEQIRKREEDSRHKHEQPRVHLPVPPPPPPGDEHDEDANRGVVIIDL